MKTFFVLLFINCFISFSQTNEVSSSPVQKTPMTEACGALNTYAESKKCMNVFLTNHVRENFDYELINCLEKKTVYNRKKGASKKCLSVLLPGEKRIFLDFTINKIGTVESISARAPHLKLKEEAIRVAKLFPKMIPGEQGGEPVSFSYSLPIDLIAK